MNEYIIKKGTKLIYEIDGAGGIYITMPEEAEIIVRCKDCKFSKWKANDCDGNEIYRCNRQIYFEVTSDGFCVWGEPKD